MYPRGIDDLSEFIGEPDLDYLTRECIANQLGCPTDDIPLLRINVSVYHSAVSNFRAPSDASGIRDMWRERIRSTPLWNGEHPRRDCAFIVEDDSKPGMEGLAVVRVQLFFSFIFEGVYYPCALVEWFTKQGRDPVTQLWVVQADTTDGARDRTVIHLDSFLRGAHLIPVYGNREVPVDFHFSYSLDCYETFYINKYIDHHANEIAS